MKKRLLICLVAGMFLLCACTPQQEESSSSSQSDPPVTNKLPTKDQWGQASDLVFEEDPALEIALLINQEREEKGLEPLEINTQLTQAAQIRCQEQSQQEHLSHQRPDGRYWDTVLRDDVPTWTSVAGENLASLRYQGYQGMEGTMHRRGKVWMDKWKNSPDHYENIVYPEFTHMGVAVCYRKYEDVNVYEAYAVVIFADLSGRSNEGQSGEILPDDTSSSSDESESQIQGESSLDFSFVHPSQR